MATGEAPALAFQQYTGFLLRRAYVVSVEHAEACIGDDTTVREIPVLTLVRDDEPMTQRRLGELLGTNRTTTGKLVDAIEAKGWVSRDRDERDRRSYALRLTEAGQGAIAELHRSLDRGEARLTKALTPDEIERLSRLLRALLTDDATLTIEGLGSRCGYLIARAHRMMFRRATEALAPLDLSPRDLGILGALAAAQPCSQQRLAAIVGVSAPGMLGFVDELESRGLVSRRRNVADRRAYDLTLTVVGTAKLAAGRKAAQRLQSSVVEGIGESAAADLRRLLHIIVESASGVPVLPAARSLRPQPAPAVELPALKLLVARSS